jgi:hypothetical protein
MPFVIKHAGTIVMPYRGKGKRRAPFDSPEEATAFALRNYRGATSWEVIPFVPKKPRVVKSTTQKNRERLEEIDAKATALFDQLNPNWETETRVSKDECIKRVMRALGE